MTIQHFHVLVPIVLIISVFVVIGKGVTLKAMYVVVAAVVVSVVVVERTRNDVASVVDWTVRVAATPFVGWVVSIPDCLIHG